jgi:hypothetical protein
MVDASALAPSRTEPSVGRRALPGCRRNRDRRRTRSDRIRVSVRVVQGLQMVDVADAQIPARGPQTGPHIIAWAPAHPRPFVAACSCRNSGPGLPARRPRPGRGRLPRRRPSPNHFPKSWVCRPRRLRGSVPELPVGSLLPQFGISGATFIHRHQSCWPHHCTGWRESTLTHSVSSMRCI